MSTPPRIPQQARSRSSRDKLTAAAKELFTSRGYQQTQAKAIASAAGVSIGTFYQYFPDKKAAFCGLIEDFFQAFQALHVETYFSPAPAQPAAPFNIPGLINTLDQWTGSYGLLYSDLNHLAYQDPEIQELLTGYQNRFEETVRRILAQTFPGLPPKRIPRISYFLYITLDALLSTLRQDPLTPAEASGLKEEAADSLQAYLRTLSSTP